MNKIVLFITLILLIGGCSLHKNSKFWTKTKDIPEEKKPNYEKIFLEEKVLSKEFNPNLKLKLGNRINNDLLFQNYYNNDGRSNYNGVLKKSSRFKSSSITFVF